MAEKEWLTYKEAMEVLGVKRSTLYTLITAENITPQKFKYSRHRYLAQSDVKRLKELREKPWIVGV